jgi:thioredoxin-like negative regulator of GroEL
MAGVNIQEIIGQRLLGALESEEEKLDNELHRMDQMGEDDIEKLRLQRMAQLKTMARQKSEWMAHGHGSYREIDDQKRFFEELKSEKRAVVHFFRPSTRRCEILDKHIGDLAQRHIETKFVRVNAERFPYVAEKLKIWMLPTLVLIKDGRTDHSIIGFDELGGADNFPTEVLEAILIKWGVCSDAYGGEARGRGRADSGDNED